MLSVLAKGRAFAGEEIGGLVEVVNGVTSSSFGLACYRLAEIV